MPANELQIVISAIDKASDVFGDIGKKFDKVGSDMMETGTKLLAAGSGFALAMGKCFDTLDKGFDAIAIGTGASGKDLEELNKIARDVAKQVPDSFENVGLAVADLNTRLGLTGDELEKATKSALGLSSMMGIDVETTVRSVTRAMLDAGIEAKNYTEFQDKLFVASQKSGISIERMADLMTTYGVQMRASGFDTDQTIALLAKWEKEGVSTEKMLGGLSMALGRFARDQKEPDKALNDLINSIKNAKTEGEALSLGVEALGARAGPDFALAVREGRFAIDDWTSALQGSEGAVDKTREATMDFTDRLAIMKNDILVELEPLFNQFADALDRIIPKMKELIDKITNFIEKHPETIDFILKFTGALIGAGGLLIALGEVIKIVGTVSTVFKALGTVFTFLTTGPIGAIILVIAALGLLAYEIYKNWDWIKAWFEELWNKIKETVSTVVDWFKGIPATMGGIVNGIVEWFKALPGRIWEAIKNVGSTIADAFSGVVDKVSGVVGGIVDWFKGLPGKIFDAIKDVGSTIAGVFSKIHIPLPHFKFWTEDKKVGPVTVPLPKWSVDWFKEGGIFNRPSLIGVGEAGPEAVVPLNKAGFGTVNVTVTGNTFMGIEDFAEQIDRILMEKLRKNLRIV